MFPSWKLFQLEILLKHITKFCPSLSTYNVGTLGRGGRRTMLVHSLLNTSNYPKSHIIFAMDKGFPFLIAEYYLHFFAVVVAFILTLFMNIFSLLDSFPLLSKSPFLEPRSILRRSVHYTQVKIKPGVNFDIRIKDWLSRVVNLRNPFPICLLLGYGGNHPS